MRVNFCGQLFPIGQPAIQQPCFDLPDDYGLYSAYSEQLNRATCQLLLRLSHNDRCASRDVQTMFQIVSDCTLTKIDGSLNQLHLNDDMWLTSHSTATMSIKLFLLSWTKRVIAVSFKSSPTQITVKTVDLYLVPVDNPVAADDVVWQAHIVVSLTNTADCDSALAQSCQVTVTCEVTRQPHTLQQHIVCCDCCDGRVM